MFKIVTSNKIILNLIDKSRIISAFFDINLLKLSKINDKKILYNIYARLTPYITTKQTFPERFEDVDKITIGYIKNNSIIHDIGVSTGITSLELFEKIEKIDFKTKLYISDKFDKIFYKKKFFLTKFYDINGNFIYGYFSNFLADNKLNKKYFISKFLYSILNFIRLKKETMKKIILYDKEIQNKLLEKKIILIDYDIFSTLIRNEFDFVRCMNLLNKSYFSDDEIIIALKNIYLSLKNKGIFQIGRTSSNFKNNVGFYKKEKGKFVLLKKYNHGSEVDYLIKRFNKLN